MMRSTGVGDGAVIRFLHEVRVDGGGSRRGLRYQLLLNWTIYFSVNHKPWVGAFLGYPTILAAGFGLSGFKYAAAGGDAIRFMLIAITAYIFVAFTALIPRRFFRTDPWPVSRARVFAAAAVPFVIALALGYAVGTALGDARTNEREQIRLLRCGDEGAQWYCMQVPVANCEIAADGVPPTLTSPWGETHTPEPMPVWRNGTFAVYSPFSVGPDSSPEFVALQASRAARAVYDAKIAPETILERYLLRADDGFTLVREGGLTLREDFPELRREPLGPMFPVIMLVVHALWLLPVVVACRPLRAGVPEKIRKAYFGGMLVALMALHFAQYGIVIAHRVEMIPASGTAMIAVRHLRDGLPGGTATVWLLCGGLIALLYFVAIRALERTESVPGDEVAAELLPVMK